MTSAKPIRLLGCSCLARRHLQPGNRDEMAPFPRLRSAVLADAETNVPGEGRDPTTAPIIEGAY